MKKAYMKPGMNVVRIQQRASILVGSMDSNGMNQSLQSEEVDVAWTRRNNGSVDWDDDWSE